MPAPPPSTCDSTGSEGGGFCPSPGGVKVAARGPPGPGGEQGPMPPGWGMTPVGSSGKMHRPFSGVPLAPSLPLASRKTTPGTSQRPLAGTSLREGSSEPTPEQRAVSDGAPGARAPRQSGVLWMPGRQGGDRTYPVLAWEIFKPALPLRARHSCYWSLGDMGTPSLGSTVGGNSQTHMVCASVPFSPWHHSQTGGEGEVKSAGGWAEEGPRGEKAGLGRGLKVRPTGPAHDLRLPLCPVQSTWPASTLRKGPNKGPGWKCIHFRWLLQPGKEGTPLQGRRELTVTTATETSRPTPVLGAL